MDIDQLIAKILQGNATEAEQAQFAEWLEASPANKTVFEAISAYFAANEPLETTTRKVHRWRTTLGKIYDHGGEALPFDLPKNEKPRFNTPVRRGWLVQYRSIAAAVIAVLCAFGWAYWKFGDIQKRKTTYARYHEAVFFRAEAALGQKKTVHLPDGTKVKLNSGASLRLLSHFDTPTREVYLKGEAYFDVVKDSLRPFIVHTDVFDVQVLGTSFNVNTQQGEKMKVGVVEGKVRVKLNNSDNKILTANQMAYWDRDSLVVGGLDKSRLAWLDNVLLIESRDFGQVVRQLEAWYGVKVTVQKKVDLGIGYKARFDNQSLENVMKSMSFSLSFKYQINYENGNKNLIIY